MDIAGKTLFFGFDDTVVMTKEMLMEARYKLLKSCELRPTDLVRDYSKMTVGEFLIAAYAAQKKYTYDILIYMYETIQRRLLITNSKLCNGVSYFIRQAKNVGCKLYIVSNSHYEFVKSALAYYDLLVYFDGLVCSDILGARKPESSMYSSAVLLSRSKLDNCIAFEEDELGVLSARNAGVNVIIINPNPGEEVTRFGYSSYPDFDQLSRSICYARN